MAAPINTSFKANQNSSDYRFVVYPQDIKPYSFYNELKLCDDTYYKFLTTTTKVSPELKQSKRRTTLQKLVKTALWIGAGVLAYKNRGVLKNFFVNAYNKIKNVVKK